MPDGTSTRQHGLDRDAAAALLAFLTGVLNHAPVAGDLSISDIGDMTTRATVHGDGGVTLNPRAAARLAALLADGDLYGTALLIHALRVNTDLPAATLADILAAARLDAVPGIEAPQVRRVADPVRRSLQGEAGPVAPKLQRSEGG